MAKRQIIALASSIAVVAAFYGVNQYQVGAEVSPQPVVIALQDIPPHTQITQQMVRQIKVPVKGLPPDVYTDTRDVIGKWSQVDYGIPQNGFLFKTKVVTDKELLDAERMKLLPNQKIFTTDVDIETSAAGNVIPGAVVDVWFTSRNNGSQDKVVSGRLYQGLYVLSAKNRKAEDITTNTTTNPPPSDKNSGLTNQQQSTNKELVPSIVQLAVTDEQLQLLQAAKTLGTLSLVPKQGALYSSAASVPNLATQNDPFDIKMIVMKQLQTAQLIQPVKPASISLLPGNPNGGVKK